MINVLKFVWYQMVMDVMVSDGDSMDGTKWSSYLPSYLQ